jgi:hypothetical protein
MSTGPKNNFGGFYGNNETGIRNQNFGTTNNYKGPSDQRSDNSGVIVNGGRVGSAIGQQTNHGSGYNVTASGGGNAVGSQSGWRNTISSWLTGKK